MNGTNGNEPGYPENALVPYPVIVAATKGDPDAMKIVLQHFSGYIARLSMRKLYDERGNVYFGVDEDIRQRLQARLMPVILGGLYGMRRSEILGLRWRNVDLENNTFDVSEQLPFKVPPKTKVIEEMAPPKSNGRKLPITELARPFFLKQFAMCINRREFAICTDFFRHFAGDFLPPCRDSLPPRQFS